MYSLEAEARYEDAYDRWMEDLSDSTIQMMSEDAQRRYNIRHEAEINIARENKLQATAEAMAATYTDDFIDYYFAAAAIVV